MITVISGTNRPGSLTSRFAEIYFSLLKEKVGNVQYFDLENLPGCILRTDVYDRDNRAPELLKLEQDYFINTSKFVFIIPEYNGSYPGILKLLLDVLDPVKCFADKKAALIGIATGRAGNLRGLDQLGDVLLHMHMLILPYILPVSRVQHEFDDIEGLKESTLIPLRKQIDRLIAF